MAHRRHRIVAAMVLAVMTAGPVAALEPVVPICHVEGPESHLIQSYVVQALDSDVFVAYQALRNDGGAMLYVVENCPERRQMVLALAYNDGLAEADLPASDLFTEMVHGEGQFTQDDMVRALRRLGAVAEIRRVDYTSCGCDFVTRGSDQ